MNEINIFEKAVIGKYRFPYKGMVSVEDLFDLSVENLDEVFKTLNASKKSVNEDSLLSVKTNSDDILDTQIEIVRNIVNRKLLERKNKTLELKKRQQKNKIEQILAMKEEQALINKTPEELKDMLEQLK